MLEGVGKFFTHRIEVKCKGGIEHQLSLCHRTYEQQKKLIYFIIIQRGQKIVVTVWTQGWTLN